VEWIDRIKIDKRGEIDGYQNLKSSELVVGYCYFISDEDLEVLLLEQSGDDMAILDTLRLDYENDKWAFIAFVCNVSDDELESTLINMYGSAQQMINAISLTPLESLDGSNYDLNDKYTVNVNTDANGFNEEVSADASDSSSITDVGDEEVLNFDELLLDSLKAEVEAELDVIMNPEPILTPTMKPEVVMRPTTIPTMKPEVVMRPTTIMKPEVVVAKSEPTTVNLKVAMRPETVVKPEVTVTRVKTDAFVFGDSDSNQSGIMSDNEFYKTLGVFRTFPPDSFIRVVIESLVEMRMSDPKSVEVFVNKINKSLGGNVSG
jgi:hypothetical protein